MPIKTDEKLDMQSLHRVRERYDLAPEKRTPSPAVLMGERDTKMGKAKRTQYTPEFRQEAVRLVESGQSIAAAARSLGMVAKTLDNGVRARRAGTLKEAANKTTVSAEQMENSRLRAELARVTMQRDILHPTNEGLFAGTPACHPTDINPSAGTPGCHPGLGKAVAYFAKGQK